MLFLWTRQPNVVQAAGPRAGPWFAWLATAVLIWRCRNRIAKVVFGSNSPLRLLKRRHGTVTSSTGGVITSKAHHHHHHNRSHKHRHHKQQQPSQQIAQSAQQKLQQQQQQQKVVETKEKQKVHKKHARPLTAPIDASGDHRRLCPQHLMKYQQQQQIGSHQQQSKPHAPVRRARLKRIHGTDGGRRLGISASCVQISEQLYCRMTRSGRVYGRYPTKPPPLK